MLTDTSTNTTASFKSTERLNGASKKQSNCRSAVGVAGEKESAKDQATTRESDSIDLRGVTREGA